MRAFKPYFDGKIFQKIFLTLLFIQLCGILLECNGKKFNDNDLVFEDKDSQAKAKIKSIDDILLNHEILNDENDGNLVNGILDAKDDENWLTKSVNRVRRSLSQLIGASSELLDNKTVKSENEVQKRIKKNTEPIKKLNGRVKRDWLSDIFKIGPKSDDVSTETETPKDDSLSSTGVGEGLMEASGDKYTDDDDELVQNYRLNVVLKEIWSDGYYSRGSEAFQSLENLLKHGFENLFRGMSDVSDVENELKDITLVGLDKTPDQFKVLATVDLKISGEGEKFGQIIRSQIDEFAKIGEVAASIEDFKYQSITEHQFGNPSSLNEAFDYPCESSDFRCTNGLCILSAKRCDHIHDCSDGSDEIGCPPIEDGDRDAEIHPTIEYSGEPDYSGPPWLNCREGETFTCFSGQEICADQRCDDVRDCDNGEDEDNCSDDTNDCDSDEFSCNNGNCVKNHVRCNRYDDCGDNSDELNCHIESTEIKHGHGGDTEAVDPRDECTEGQFTCHDGYCISIDLKCNKVNDCNDGSDEEDCTKEDCRSDQYQCASGECIPRYLMCDRHRDCPDGDDEGHCPTECGYQCKEGSKCINKNQVCDGDEDCPSGDDEDDCSNIIPILKYFCPEGKFTCKDLSCISIKGRCDGKVDCPFDRSDEEGCPCLYDKWQCDDMSCISIDKRCDGNIDCPNDMSDERDCNVIIPGCKLGEFLCDNGQCLPLKYRCNQNYECTDYSDEKNCSPSTEPSSEYETTLPTTSPSIFTRYTTKSFYPTINPNRACTADHFACKNGFCLPIYLRCDGRYHCNDKSDEENCSYLNTTTPRYTTTTTRRTTTTKLPYISTTTHKNLIPNCLTNEFACLDRNRINYICIQQSMVCDGYRDCPFDEDENDSLCVCEQFKCLRYGGCVNTTRVCNGVWDCKDGSDESNCDNFCESNEFECDLGNCILNTSRCDGRIDCEDHTDELDCTKESCNKNEFQCDHSYCIPIENQCNGVNNCLDGTDEKNCTTCTNDAFHCTSGECIKDSLRCNSRVECLDGSDEMECVECNEYRCNNGICLHWINICDNTVQCPDGSDEFNCNFDHPDHNHINQPCAVDQWKCDNNECINLEFLCDGQLDCYDQSDEVASNCQKPASVEDCGFDEFYCDEKCHPHSIYCNGYPDCLDRKDEENCIPATTPTPVRPTVRYPCPEYTCSDNGKCYSRSEKCDRIHDCDDGSDEWHCIICKDDEFFCYDHQICINITQRCDGFYDCKDYSDEQNCFGCEPHQFTCSNGACATKCNNIRECSDGRDEENCPTYPPTSPPSYGCQPNQFRCNNGQCISGYAKCDGRSDCADYSDEENCRENKRCDSDQFRCENGPCISNSLRCNGKADCPFDNSDELDCQEFKNIPQIPAPRPSDPQLNLKTYPSSQIIKERYIKEGREVVFSCRDEGPSRVRVRWTRPNGGRLPATATDRDGRLEIANIRTEDQGEYICEAIGYSSWTRGQSITVSLTVEPYDHKHTSHTACTSNQATCMNGECIDKTGICDGIPHCSDGSDEHSCSNVGRCSPNQFKCRNTKCVDRIWRCDGENDCGDNSDEESCDPNPSGAPCRYDEYQCRSGHCVPKSFHCDGTNDCQDGSDEVGCMAPSVIRRPPPRVDLRPGETLNITCTSTGVPTPVIVWRLNWGHVPDKCVSTSTDGFGTLYCPNMQKPDSGAYSCEILNTKGGVFVNPDTIVMVIPDGPGPNVCPAGFFNMLASSRDECINCFCFGISRDCKSADLYSYALNAPITSHKVVGVEIPRYGGQVIFNDFSGHDLINMRHGVQFRVSDVPYSSQVPYLELPADYQGSQLKSYGGNLKFTVQYNGNGRPNNDPDIILVGSGYILVHKSAQRIEANIKNQINAKFALGQWQKSDGRQATREEIMMALVNVERILIRLQYIDTTEREVEITDITMDSASIDDKGLGSASLVEQCVCPTGYAGFSCEQCAPGFVRQPSGPWLGRCVPVQERCEPGTYGDPSRYIPCKPCPCPLTNRDNNFARSCSLGPDGEPICDCERGYTGRRCERCEPGYEGNPTVPGGRCVLGPVSRCNQLGTYIEHPNGTCECKLLVEGPYCDTCGPNSFHLNYYSQSGCTECFCMGITKQCTSSNYYRDKIQYNFSPSRQRVDDFTLISNYEDAVPARLDVQVLQNQLVFRGRSDSSDVLYWSFPKEFLGNKLTSYGGVLNYTLRYNAMPGGQMSRNVAPDVVIKSANDIVILHYRKNEMLASVSQSYSIPIVESSWQRNDGIVINREHLLMALADVEAIYIKATYTTVTEEGALLDVSLDTATKSYTGTQRAVEVERCSCPAGYIGLSCEDCAPGFRRSQEEGLYLGICEPCECNRHSSLCDSESGICQNCDHNTEGNSCERCAYGFNGNATRGTPYDCQRSINPNTDDRRLCTMCDEHGTVECINEQCQCKQNVVGQTCNQCRGGTFNLNKNNVHGCSECFCSGVTVSCSEGRYYKQEIPFDFLSSKPSITDAEGNIIDEDNLELDVPNNMYNYKSPSYTHKYWSLSSRLLGDQVKSYGLNLEFIQIVEGHGQFEPGQDVILFGNGIKIYWSRPSHLQDKEKLTIRLDENEEWQRLDRNGVHRASRTDIMTVLSNIDNILIRATPKIPISSSSLGDIVLETADTSGYGDPTSSVEVCSCPREYEGTSCQNCAPLYYRNASRTSGLFGRCLPCPCSENTESCSLNIDGYTVCHCKNGYYGDRCQYDNYQPSTTHRPIEPTISVTISNPGISIIPVGGSIDLNCEAYVIATGTPISVTWYKLNGRMPTMYAEDRGVLHLINLQAYDSGVYVCKGQYHSEVVEKQIPVNVGPEEGDVPRKPTVRIEPSYLDLQENQPIDVSCAVTGYPSPYITWTKADGPLSPYAVVDRNRLYIQSVRKSDEGTYRCHALNTIGSDEKILTIYVRQSRPEVPTSPPYVPHPTEIYIEPSSFNGRVGDTVHLNCRIQSVITMAYRWLKDNEDLYRHRNIDISDNTLTIREATVEDTGSYQCVASDSRSREVFTSTSYVQIDDYPHPTHRPQDDIQIVLKEQYVIIQGRDLSIVCEANGPSYPKITWTKLGGSIESNIQINGNTLRIINAQPSNRGLYICEASTHGSVVQATTNIDIDPREHPTVDIHPQQPQKVRVGGSAVLNCRALGIPQPRITWRRPDGKRLSQRIKQEHEGSLLIEEITLEDAGSYECIAENEVGTASATGIIIMEQLPRITIVPDVTELEVTEGEELKLICMAEGSPTPNVAWIHDSRHEQELVSRYPSQAVLEIRRVRKEDAKLYTCTATNSAGTEQRYITVRVRSLRGDVGTHGIDEPHHIPYQDYAVPIGEEALIICESDGLQTYWSRPDGSQLPPNAHIHGNNLTISRVTHANLGLYRCTGVDYTGQPVTYHDTNVILLDIPHITLHPEMPMTVRQGDNVQIYCNVTGAYPISIEWHAENHRQMPPNVHTSGQLLIFDSIKYNDAGRYYCSASNRYGNATKVAEVIVNRDTTVVGRPSIARQQTIFEGQDVHLDCGVPREVLRPGVTFTWKFSENRLPYNAAQRDQILYLQQVRLDNAGRYTCEVYSSGEIIGSSSVDLIINRVENPIININPITYVCQTNDFKCKSHPRTCVQSNRVCDGIYDCTDHSDELYCNEINNFLPNIQNQRNYRTTNVGIKKPNIINKTVAISSAIKSITKTTINPRFKRWKKDRYNKIFDIASINHPPQYPDHQNNFDRLPILKLDQQNAILKVGESTEVECYTSDTTYPDVVWERSDGKPLPTNVQQIGNKLVITNADISNTGDYVCKCHTDRGDLYTTSYELKIKGKRPWKRHEPKVEHAEVGSMIKLNCEPDHYPSTFKWARQYGQMKPGREVNTNELRLENIQASDAGTYICTVTEMDGNTVEKSTILVVTGAIPHFHQAPRSYMAFPALENAMKKFKFEVTVRPEQPNGLILYSGEKKRSGKYISLSLNDLYPEFRFYLGRVPVVVRAEKPITLKNWHTIKVIKTRFDGYLLIDDEAPIAFPNNFKDLHLDLTSESLVLLGGAPNWDDLVPNSVENNEGFVGCISQLVLQDKIIELLKDVKHKEGITSCEPCADDPCENSGICLESQTEAGYSCVCQENFTGKTCAIEGNSCAPGVCGSGNCVNTDIGMECYCPLNKTGDRCQYNVRLDESVLSFNGGSYAGYKTPRSGKVDIRFHIKPASLEDSVVLYVAESDHVSGDFLAVVIKDKHLEYICNAGGRVEPVTVRSKTPLELDKWTEVHVTKKHGNASIQLNNDQIDSGTANFRRSLSFNTHLYIGGYDKRNLLDRSIAAQRGFVGCISNIKESNRTINLIADMLDAANVQNCGDNNEIASIRLPTNYIDNNSNESPCSENPCHHDGVCTPIGNSQYKCQCRLGHVGKDCEEYDQLDSSAHFKSDGFLEINRTVFAKEINLVESFIAILFDTTQNDGLLIWWGQEKNKRYENNDYIALAIVNGHLELSFRLNGQQNSIKNTQKKINDNHRHIAVIKHYEHEFSLELDHLIEIESIDKPTARKEMQLPGNVFIGGAPRLAEFTGGRYTHGFNGCARIIEAQDTGAINLGQYAVDGINVASCPSDDDLENSEPPLS